MRAPFFVLVSTVLLTHSSSCKIEEHNWAIDSLWIEVDENNNAFGFHTWQIYDANWSKQRASKHHICAVVVELNGEPTTTCPSCFEAWDIQANVLESDCGDSILTTWNWAQINGLGISKEPSMSSTLEFNEDEMGAWLRWQNDTIWEGHGSAHSPEGKTYRIDTPWAWRLSP